MYAQLDIWRSAAAEQQQQHLKQQPQAGPSPQPRTKEEAFDISYVLQMLDKDDTYSAAAAASTTPSTSYTSTQSMTSPPPPYPGYEQHQQLHEFSEAMEDDADEGEEENYTWQKNMFTRGLKNMPLQGLQNMEKLGINCNFSSRLQLYVESMQVFCNFCCKLINVSAIETQCFLTWT